MSSLILRTAARYLIPLLLLFSIFLLVRGHNHPGGGFAGGLLAATAFAIYLFASDARTTREALRIDPHLLIGAGLLTTLASGLAGLMGGRAFLASFWGTAGGEPIGTPLLFDLGVYLVVLGSVLLIVLSLGEE